ncbi:unnamed protein product [Porites evermanni]|uniref:Uncharacterized protein n=1 Tax=Porites evermanni TaxID=104178 RepID=A0ABN8SJH6_9CNID|nr:unnamed protein product [Porites evermanni]
MLKMNKRGKDVNWSKLANASPKPKRLHLEEDDCYELVDYQKVNGASESLLRGLASTEIYLKKVRKTVSKMMRLQWTSELEIDALEAKGQWATLAELIAQSTIFEDQKHSFVVARVHYQNQRSREVARKAHEYLERLHGEKGSELEIAETCARGLVQAILRLLKIRVVSKLTLSQMMREKRSQKHHSSVSQVSRHKSGRIHL